MEPISLRTPLALLLSSLGMIAALWWWLATPITLPRAPIDPTAKLQCVSYAPFRGAQTPLIPTTQILPEQIAQDLAQLAKITDCVRTYSIDNGLDQVPALAAKVGLKVIQGIWLSSNRIKNLAQISVAIELTKEHPDVITALVVGNEVLLRGEMTTSDLAAHIRSVKSRVTVPVTYADVWEFWLRNREVYDAVDFVTIHILPYWEDMPVRAKHAASHVDDIRKRMAVSAFVFLAGWLTLRRRPWKPRLAAWIAVGTSATTAGMLLGVAADKMYYESYGVGGWLQWGALLAAAIASPLLCANAAMSGRPLPTFLELLGPRDGRTKSVLTALLGLVLGITTLIAAETALGFSFDPRYRDFPFASLTMAVVPFAALMLLNRPKEGVRPIAESTFAGLLVAAALFTGFNEGNQNWQSMWTCAIYLLLALTLWRAG